MSPFEALYGRRCRTPINWSESGERPFFGQDFVKDDEDQVRIIRENLRIAQSRQKMKRSMVKFVKVQWSNHSEDEATWEREDRLRQEYPEFFFDE